MVEITQQSAEFVVTLEASRTSSAERAEAQIVRGTLIGRYVVVSRLGAGAMGVVYAAYDPELDRKVALKLLKPRYSDTTEERLRLQREAQALAKLDHPNVVSVYDVGVHESRVFVAMEFVDGQTLRAWMDAAPEPRPWREILQVFSAAGRGLAAAHDAGLVHRDFKPDNVMIGREGRVRVMDFGLARVLDDIETPSGERGGGSGETSAAVPDNRLTQTGMMLGTPAYMSAEQFAGRPVDARSDQFGFCVALYEAFYGQRPFEGRSLWELGESVKSGELRAAPRLHRVPAWLRRVLIRGLAPEPDERWPSMHALLDALADDPAQRRRKWGTRAAAVGVVGGAVALVLAIQAEPPVCTAMADKLVGVWDDERRGAVEAALVQTELRYATQTWERVERRLDVYTSDWVAARTAACEATQRGEQSAELLDRRMACLDERLSHVRALVGVLERPDPKATHKAVEAAQGLPGLERCADVDVLMAEVLPPEDPQVAAQVVDLRARLAAAEAEERAGREASSRAEVDAVVEQAAVLGYEPLLVWAWQQQAWQQHRGGDLEEAEATLERVYDMALGLGMIEQAAIASVQLVVVVGRSQARHRDGRRWVVDAGPLVRLAGRDAIRASYFDSLGLVAEEEGDYEQAREHMERALAIKQELPEVNPFAVAGSLTNLGNVMMRAGDYTQARAHIERSLRIRQEALGPEHPDTTIPLANLGNVARKQGNLDEAREHYARALEIALAALGPQHLRVADLRSNLGIVAYRSGELSRARADHERALAIREAILGPDHPNVAVSLTNLSLVAKAEGASEQARAHLERALAIKRAALGPEHPSLAFTLGSLGNVAEEEGALDRARDYHEQALAIRRSALSPDHPDVATSLSNLGLVAHGQGDDEKAQAYHEQALAIRERALGSDHPRVAFSLTGLGDALLGQGRAGDAIAPLERALAIREAKSVTPRSLAQTRFALAQALWSTPDEQRDRVRARTLAEAAERGITEASKSAAAERAEIQRWLQAHSP